ADDVPANSNFISYARLDGEQATIEIGFGKESLPSMVDQLEKSRDIRLILVPRWLHPTAGDVYYLYWDDDSDLEQLDDKIRQDIFTDENFQNSVKTLYQQTICFNCHNIWKTLVIPTGDPNHGGAKLEQAKISNKSTRNAFKRCPNCGA